LRRTQVTDLLDALTAQGLMRTANMTLSLLRQFIRWCSVRDWIERDPTLALSKAAIGGKEKPRDRVLSEAEIVELQTKLAAAGLPERINAALWLILATGVRVGELSSAKVSDFDLDASTWLIPDTKNGQPHLVHLSDFAKQQVKRLMELRGAGIYLLPSRGQDRPIDDSLITKMVGDRQRETPLKGRSKASGALLLASGKWTPHDLRRTMATLMRERLTISSDVVERCLNHKPQGIVGVYQVGQLHEERRMALDAWGRFLEGLLKPASRPRHQLMIAQ
jgi:integrase